MEVTDKSLDGLVIRDADGDVHVTGEANLRACRDGETAHEREGHMARGKLPRNLRQCRLDGHRGSASNADRRSSISWSEAVRSAARSLRALQRDPEIGHGKSLSRALRFRSSARPLDVVFPQPIHARIIPYFGQSGRRWGVRVAMALARMFSGSIVVAAHAVCAKELEDEDSDVVGDGGANLVGEAV